MFRIKPSAKTGSMCSKQCGCGVGGGCLRVGTALGLVQARCCGALHHRRAVGQQAVEAIDSAAKGTGHGKGDTLSAAGIQKAVCGALAAIGHRQGVDVSATQPSSFLALVGSA